jgi:uncharacterized caspase-like protein
MRQLVAALGALLLMAAMSSGQAQDRLAFVVGIDKYQKLEPLKKAGNDAVAVGAALEKLGFSVDVLRDADRRTFNRTLSDFLNKIKPGAIVYFHFSGHGVSLDGDSYLIPADMELPRAGDREFVKREAIRLSELVDSFRAAQAQARIMVIDACRENPFAAKGVRSIGTRGGLALVPAPKGTLIMYSASDGQLALDGLGPDDKEPTSVYTRTLLKHLAQADTDLVTAARAIRAEVERIAASIGHEQRPAYYDELSEELILAAAAAVNAKRRQQQQIAAAPTTSPASDKRLMRNINLQGEDYLTMRMPLNDPLLCQAACRSDNRCASWTFVGPSARSPQSQQCWLKNKVPKEFSCADCTAGIERTEPVSPWPSQEALGQIMAGINLYGQDFRNFEPAQADAKLCQATCREDQQCRAWTFDGPSENAKNGRCWLKNRIPVQLPNTRATSGIERMQ